MARHSAGKVWELCRRDAGAPLGSGHAICDDSHLSEQAVLGCLLGGEAFTEFGAAGLGVEPQGEGNSNGIAGEIENIEGVETKAEGNLGEFDRNRQWDGEVEASARADEEGDEEDGA